MCCQIHRLLGIILVVAFLSPGSASGQAIEGLGTIVFPNSGAPEAQEQFLRGVAMLHSFEWEDAAEAFQEARKLDGDFYLTYWGEALSYTYGHHFPSGQNIAKARAVLKQLGETQPDRLGKAPTDRERGYMEAVEKLYGNGDALERNVAYAEAMKQMKDMYPDDLEAAAFYSLALMRTKVFGDESVPTDIRAGALAEEIFRKNPDHPGAAHYIIHAFDTPLYAPLALHAAKKYAKIAPEAVHALHMPSHIFVQHGMWDQVAAMNEASYSASVKRVERKGLSPVRRSWHALFWLQYAYLQQGRYDKAEECLDIMRPVMERETVTQYFRNNLAMMEARYTIETGEWYTPTDMDLLDKKLTAEATRVSPRAYASVMLAAGMSAVKTGDLAKGQKAEDAIEIMMKQSKADDNDREMNQVMIIFQEISALNRLANGEKEAALELIQKAVAMTEAMKPPSGPPGEAPNDEPIKPAHEMYGEILMELERFDEAAVQFAESLRRMPYRARSLLGAARAAARTGDTMTAKERYTELNIIWGDNGSAEKKKEIEQFLSESE